jgi:hypothetical protein
LGSGDKQPGGGGPSNIGDPIPMVESGSLSGAGWSNILTRIQNEGKYVELDLSACTGGGAEFNPGTANTGEKYIVSLILPNTATSVKASTFPDSTFKHFSALKSVTGGAVTGIGGQAFYQCTSLKTVDFPAATTIGSWAFGGCNNLTSVNIPSITTINSHAFNRCTGLTLITLPTSLTYIEDNPFHGCINLTAITVADGNPNYKHSDDYKMILDNAGTTLIAYPSASGPVTLPGITNVRGSAFQSCTGLTSITLPAATTVGSQAFGDCYTLATVNLPEAASIGGNAFLSCSSLKTLNLPKAASIDDMAFQATGTQALTVTLGDTVPTLGLSMFISAGPKSVTVKVPNTGAWSGKTGSFTGNNTTDNWGNGFRGGAWTGTGMRYTNTVNANISLTIGLL